MYLRTTLEQHHDPNPRQHANMNAPYADLRKKSRTLCFQLNMELQWLEPFVIEHVVASKCRCEISTPIVARCLTARNEGRKY